jgi:hypothetical protein
MNKIRLALLAAALVFTISAQARHPEGTKIPQLDIQGAPPSVVSAAICHFYSDYREFTKKWEEIKLIPDEEIRVGKLRNLLLITWTECIINMHLEINSYKNSL